MSVILTFALVFTLLAGAGGSKRAKMSPVNPALAGLAAGVDLLPDVVRALVFLTLFTLVVTLVRLPGFAPPLVVSSTVAVVAAIPVWHPDHLDARQMAGGMIFSWLVGVILFVHLSRRVPPVRMVRVDPRTRDERRFFSDREKEMIARRDGWRCRYCGVPGDAPGVVLAVDHVVPWSKGGPTDVRNGVLACSSCNLMKGGRSLEEFSRLFVARHGREPGLVR